MKLFMFSLHVVLCNTFTMYQKLGLMTYKTGIKHCYIGMGNCYRQAVKYLTSKSE